MEVTGFTAAESSWIGRNRGTAQWRSFNASGPIGGQIEDSQRFSNYSKSAI
jgi:hypothetical protein